MSNLRLLRKEAVNATDQILPVNGTDAIEILKNDHKVIKALLNDLTQPVDGERRRMALGRLKAALTIHNATEENIVYPALQLVAAEKRHAEHLYRETAQADVMVFSLDNLYEEADDAAFMAKATKLHDAVIAHATDEETSAFPKLADAIGVHGAKRLTQSVREFRNEFRFEPSG